MIAGVWLAVALGAAPLELSGEAVSLTPAWQVLADAEGKLTADEAMAAEGWAPLGAPTPGFTWARVDVHAASDSEWMLTPEARLGEDLTLFTRGPDTWSPLRCGTSFPFDVRPVEYGLCLFPVKLEGGKPTTLLFRTNTPVAQQHWSLVPARHLVEEVQLPLLFAGMYLGFTLVMAAYNLLLYGRLRERAYLLYAVYLAGLCLNQAIISGLAFQYLFPGAAVSNRFALPLDKEFTALAALFFAREFLDTKRAFPGANRLLLAAISAVTVSVPLTFFISSAAANTLSSVAVVVTALLILAVSALGARRGFRPARVFLVAWAVFLVTIVANNLTVFGWLPVNAFTARAFMVGTAIEVVLLARALADRIEVLRSERDSATARTRLVERLTRYFPRKLVDRILGERDSESLGQHRKRITMLFSDLTGFTTFADESPPERVSQVLNEYLAEMVPIIERHGGTIDKVMGDGIMALFGAADEMAPEAQARAAVETGLDMQRRLAQLNDKWRGEGVEKPVRMRIGVNQDEVTVGNFGTKDLKSFTAIGGGVNLAARLESSCTPGRVQVSGPVYELTSKSFSYGAPVEKLLKGFSKPHTLYEVEPALSASTS